MVVVGEFFRIERVREAVVTVVAKGEWMVVMLLGLNFVDVVVDTLVCWPESNRMGIRTGFIVVW